MSSLISIAGAGSGYPEFLTIKALKRIQEADCILHDALISDEILNLAKPEAQRIYLLLLEPLRCLVFHLPNEAKTTWYYYCTIAQN